MVLFPSSSLTLTTFQTSSLYPFLNSHTTHLFINPVRLIVWLPQPVFLRSYSLKAQWSMFGGTSSTHLGSILGNGIEVRIRATNVTIHIPTYHPGWGQEDVWFKMGNPFILWFYLPFQSDSSSYFLKRRFSSVFTILRFTSHQRSHLLK